MLVKSEEEIEENDEAGREGKKEDSME